MPAPPPSGYGNYGQPSQPSCFDKMKVGFMMGLCVGMASGGLFGGFSALRNDCLTLGDHGCIILVGPLANSMNREAILEKFAQDQQEIYNHEHPKYGLRGRELLQTVGKAMVQGGGTFGTFLAIGTGIRC